jgi:hypothetical protein
MTFHGVPWSSEGSLEVPSGSMAFYEMSGIFHPLSLSFSHHLSSSLLISPHLSTCTDVLP